MYRTANTAKPSLPPERGVWRRLMRNGFWKDRKLSIGASHCLKPFTFTQPNEQHCQADGNPYGVLNSSGHRFDNTVDDGCFKKDSRNFSEAAGDEKQQPVDRCQSRACSDQSGRDKWK